jgi:hypothetical protein
MRHATSKRLICFLVFIAACCHMVLFALPDGFKAKDRWVDGKGWTIPDAGMMKLEKTETIKDVIGEDICVETYMVDGTAPYTIKQRGLKPDFKVGKEIVENDIEKLKVYTFCGSKEILFYWVSAIEVKQRDPEFGVLGNGTSLIYADLNQDGVFESCFDGAYADDVSNPATAQAIQFFYENRKKKP